MPTPVIKTIFGIEIWKVKDKKYHETHMFIIYIHFPYKDDNSENILVLQLKA